MVYWEDEESERELFSAYARMCMSSPLSSSVNRGKLGNFIGSMAWSMGKWSKDPGEKPARGLRLMENSCDDDEDATEWLVKMRDVLASAMTL